MSLDPAARAAWIAYADHIEGNIGPGGPLEPIRGLANKLPEHAARLAGILMLVDDPTAPEIDGAHMAFGIELAEHYGAEALRLFAAGRVGDDLRLAQRLLDWLQTGLQEPLVSLPDIYQRGPNAIRDAGTARRLANLLAEHGWLVPVEGGATVAGVRRLDVWQIILGGYVSAYRKFDADTVLRHAAIEGDRAAKVAKLAKVDTPNSVALVGLAALAGGPLESLPVGDDPASWHAWFHALAHRKAIVGCRTLAEALQLAYGAALNEWHRRHGARADLAYCAGCGEPLTGKALHVLPDSARVHGDNLRCWADYGQRWRSAAADGLVRLGVAAPAGLGAVALGRLPS